MNAVEINIKPESNISHKAAKCDKMNGCSKIKVILDHDLLDCQYAEAISDACERCN